MTKIIRFTNQEDTEEKKSGIDFKEEMKEMKVTEMKEMKEEKETMSHSVGLKREKSVSESTSTEVKCWKLY